MNLLKLIFNCFSISGGLVYHYSAFRHQKLWTPFKKNINIWLNNIDSRKDHLLLIGPSAGYTLSSDFINSFKKITCYDLDPLAPYFFKKNHPSVNNIQWIQQDLFRDDKGNLSSKLFSKTLHEIDLSLVIFCNILGQIPLTQKGLTAEIYHTWLKEIEQALAHQNWASYHEVYSQLPENSEQYSEYFVKPIRQWPIKGPSKPFTVFDHLLQGFFHENYNKKYFLWKRLPNYIHLIETVHQTAK